MAGPSLYFAYGSNMEPVQMRRRCPGSAAVGPAAVAGYALTFPIHSSGDWQGGVASIEPAAADAVEGVLYRVTAAHLAALDRYEAVAEGMYRRGQVRATLPNGRTQDALTYFAIRGYNDPAPPSRWYLDAIVAGARHHGLSAGYLARLELIATLD